MKVGARYIGQGKCEYIVWAPFLKEVAVKIVSPRERIVPMDRDQNGYFKVAVDDAYPGTKYLYKLDNSMELPDPASYFQPEGVHKASEVIDHTSFKWEDKGWPGVPLEDMVIYELHVGVFTPEGTFKAVIERLDELLDLGINAIEIMPVAQFAGGRNWGYDGVYPYAVQNSYGGPDDFKELINAAHKRGISVILDVVYNHLGPEGNYINNFGPYFTDKYKSPWGQAINFDGAYNEGVRNFFIENALYWFREYHIDALRIDAIHGIYDLSAVPFLEELADEAAKYSKEKGRKFFLIVESDLNDSRVIRPKQLGGMGIDAQWNDDYHHCIHTLLTGEKNGYYEDFGKIEDLLTSLKDGYVYSGRYSSYRKRNHGNKSADRSANQFVVFSQNHDQVGNRAKSDRLSTMVSLEVLKLAAGLVILSPYIPLIFMGEEYGEEAPFYYFTSHSDASLIKAVREGRKNEFNSFGWKDVPPDPQDEKTFLESKLNWDKKAGGRYKVLFDFYRDLIKLRRETPALANLDKNNMEAGSIPKDRLVFFRRWCKENNVFCIFNLSDKEIEFGDIIPKGDRQRIFDSSLEKWLGPGSSELTIKPFSFVVYTLK